MGIPLHTLNMLDGSTRSGGYDLARLDVGMILSVASTVGGNAVTGVTIGAAGTGYTSLPTITPVGGTFTTPMTIIATTLASGGLTGVQITNSGNYTVAPTSFTVTGGGGSGATVTTPVLGGAGNNVITSVVFNEPIGVNYFISLSPNVSGDAFWVSGTKNPAGFSISFAPAAATSVAPAAVIDVMVFA